MILQKLRAWRPGAGTIGDSAPATETWVIAACALLAGAGAFTFWIRAEPTLPPSSETALPRDVQSMNAADPRNLRPIAPAKAVEVNAAIPIAEAANPAAAAFLARTAGEGDRVRSLDCLTSAIYYEAANEPADGQRAVAQVVLNRVRHPAYPNSVCGVVFQGSERRTGCQFTFTCDGSLTRRPSTAGWARARAAAEAALAGAVFAPVGYATHYHANYVVPYWADSLLKTAVVGAHIFYRFTGRAGRPGAFSARYAGIEPLRGTPSTAATAEPRAEPDGPPASLTLSSDFAQAADIPEERAEDLDRFGLIRPRSADRPQAPMRGPDLAVGAAIAAAVGTGAAPVAPAAAAEAIRVASRSDLP